MAIRGMVKLSPSTAIGCQEKIHIFVQNYNTINYESPGANSVNHNTGPGAGGLNSREKAGSINAEDMKGGVGDGPWEGMMRFMDKIPARGFNNFKFVNYVVQQHKIIEIKDFARAALMEIPIQYKAANRLGLLGLGIIQ